MAQLQVSYRFTTLPIQAVVQLVGTAPITGFQLIGTFYHPDPVYPDSTVLYHGVQKLLASRGMTAMQDVRIVFIDPESTEPKVPFMLIPPTIENANPARIGSVLIGALGSWAYPPSSYSFTWLKDDIAIPFADEQSYIVVPDDFGSVITFQVIAHNEVGSSTPAISEPTNEVLAKAILNTKARYGVGNATAAITLEDATVLLTNMKSMGGSSNMSRVGTFTNSPAANQYGWAAFEASISGEPTGVVFTDFMGTGGWQGASSLGQNVQDDIEDERNTSVVVHEINGVSWRFFRQSYMGAKGAFMTS